MDEAHFVFFSGPSINEPVVQHGPFVMNKAEEIAEAIADFKSGKF